MGRVVLVGPEVEENLSLRYLVASLERAGFPTLLLPFDSRNDLVWIAEHILALPEPPLVVALSLAFQARAMDFLSFGMLLRQRGYAGHLTAGGHFATFEQRNLLRDFPELDSICLHESEESLAELVRAVAAGQSVVGIPGVACRDQAPVLRPPPELTGLPWPDRRGEPLRCLGLGVAPLVGSRGCYARCAFCCIAAWHGQAAPGKRFRLRPVADIAAEMRWLQRERGISVFLFHDDNFFLPGETPSLDRIHGLADALEKEGMGPFATVLKARPNDVTPAVFGAVVERLGCIRTFLGVESNAHQGLLTLERGVTRAQNHAALRLLEQLGVYVCFNLLIFEPDATLESLEDNVKLMEEYPHHPFNFARAELYAGTPLLARMQAEGRTRGDYLGFDYLMPTPEVQRVFELTMAAYHGRNFAEGSMANRLMGTRFDVAMARHFYPDLYRPEWLGEAQRLSRTLALDSARGLRCILEAVRKGGPGEDYSSLLSELVVQTHRLDEALRAEASALESTVRAGVQGDCRHSLPRPAFAPPKPHSSEEGLP